MDAQRNERDRTSQQELRPVILLSNTEYVLQVRDKESPEWTKTLHSDATRLPLEASTASAARILGRLAELLRQEASHNSGSTEEEEGSEAHLEMERKADSNPGVSEAELEDGGAKDTSGELLKDIES